MKLFTRFPPPTDINTPENQEFKKQIDEQIDLMEQYKPYHYMTTMLRGELSAKTGIYKKHAIGLMKLNNGSYVASTSLGDVKYYNAPSDSRRREIILKALELEGYDFEAIMNEIQEMESTNDKRRHVIKVNTSGLSCKPEVTAKCRELLNKFAESRDNVKAPNDVDAYIATAIAWIRDNLTNHKAYLAAYNEMKRIFDKASRVRHFPRLYIYNGVVLVWDVIQCLPSFEQMMKAYMMIKSKTAWANLIPRMRDLCKDECRCMFELNAYGYEDLDEDDDDEENN
jgi:hypothetical protein